MWTEINMILPQYHVSQHVKPDNAVEKPVIAYSDPIGQFAKKEKKNRWKGIKAARFLDDYNGYFATGGPLRWVFRRRGTNRALYTISLAGLQDRLGSVTYAYDAPTCLLTWRIFREECQIIFIKTVAINQTYSIITEKVLRKPRVKHRRKDCNSFCYN